jgi:endoglucanase
VIRRRAFLAGAAAGLAGAGLAPRAALGLERSDPLLPLWEAWKTIHVSSAGRVIDRLQDNVSHSEGQGYALLIAEALGDREGFEVLLDWTLANLAVRNDALLAWRWHPADGGGVTDRNNASDGDLFASWALLRAAERFGTRSYADIGRGIAADLSGKCLAPCPGEPDSLLLVPGAEGFATADGFVVNPAYYMLRALGDIAAATGESALARCAADGNALLSRLARERLVPDWVEVTAAGLAAAHGRSSDYGYEAMRVPLYLVWSGLPGHPAVARAREAYAPELEAGAEGTPTVIDRQTGAVRARSPDPGYRALAALATCADRRDSGRLMPAFAVGQAYYPGILHLLSLLAQRETELGCILR